ncbi:MAG: MCE family protein, partial [Deltaproteobacteria bacterium]|nr:MCE family protein [Deltaproteobacteria bacterium]
FIGSVFLIGQERKLFSRQVEYYTTFRDVKGLSDGAPIRLGGITIGRVYKIAFSPNPKDPNVELTLFVDAVYADRIRSDSEVSIETQGLLGDRFLSITTGTASKALPVGGTIKTRETGDIAEIMDKAGQVVNTTVEIADNINQIIKEVKSDAIGDFSRAAKNIADLTEAIESGEGLAHQIIYDKEEGQKILSNLHQASTDLNEIIAEVRKGRGILHALIYDKQGKQGVRAVTAAAKNLAKASNEISAIATQIKSGDGLVHDLIYGKSGSHLEDTLQKLDRTAANLEQASRNLAEGGGTIGALLVDSQLYDNLVEVTDGAKRSFILRQAIKSSLEK